jgi:CHAT domain-containing protein
MALADQVLAREHSPYEGSIAHQARGIVLRDNGRHAEATTQLRTAVRMARTSGSHERVADALATLGATLGLAGRTKPGLAKLDEALASSAGTLAGRVLVRRASVLREAGRHADALADLHKAMAILHRAGDAIWMARVHTHRFLIYVALGQAFRAERELVAAERLFAASGQELESAMMVHNRAEVAFLAGDLPAALGFLDEAAGRYAELSAPEPNLLIDRCSVLLAAGLAGEALASAEAAIGLDTNGALKRAELLLVAARAALAAGEPVIAAERARAARDLFRRQQREWWQARASFVLLQSRYSTGERGGRLARQASALADRLDQIGTREALDAHLLAGRLAGELRRDRDADRHLAQAARFRHRGSAFARTAGWLGQALRATAHGTTHSALNACARGLDAAEEHLHTLGATELRAYGTRYGYQLAALAQSHAVQRRDARQLLWWSERWRASALAVPPARPPDDRALATELAALRSVMWRLDSAGNAEVAAKLHQERARLETAIRDRTRRTAGHPQPSRSSGAAQVAEILDRLDGHQLIELITVSDTLYAVVADEQRVRLHTVGPTNVAIREVELARFMLRRLAYGLTPDGALAGLRTAGRRLQDALLGPATEDLDGRPVVIVPPGRLDAVPWALLPALRAASIRVAPSAAIWLRAMNAKPPRKRRAAFVVGPGLDGTIEEVTRIAAQYTAPIILRAGTATAERTLAALDGAWMAHIAAHGAFRADNPLFSALRLDDGPLTGYDLARLNRAPFRLVLSSCDSAVAAHIGGDELLSLASALVPLGTASLLASVVPVHDAVTAQFMIAFHDQLCRSDSFPDALCAAQADADDDPIAVATAMSFVALGR